MLRLGSKLRKARSASVRQVRRLGNRGLGGARLYRHFLEGRCTDTHESGEAIEATPDTAEFFPKDWMRACRVHEIVRKVYMIR